MLERRRKADRFAGTSNCWVWTNKGAGLTIRIWWMWLFTSLKGKLPSLLARKAVWQSYPLGKPSRNSSSSSANDITERNHHFARVPHEPFWLRKQMMGKDDCAQAWRDKLTLAGGSKRRVSWVRITWSLCLELEDASTTEAREILAKGQIWLDL